MLLEMYKLGIYKELTPSEMFTKLLEEVNEVQEELARRPYKDKNKLAGELLDVMQTCVGLATTENINLENHVQFHNTKLAKRKHELIR